MDLRLAGQDIPFHDLILGEKAFRMIFGMGAAFGHLNTALAADSLTTTEIGDKHICLAGPPLRRWYRHPR
jgi:hypothetical protein